MEAKYQVPRGTYDIFDDDITLWQQVESVIKDVCKLYNYQEIRTPIFENTEVYKFNNDSSDMVNKEMYTFVDNGNRSLSLRPEGTKGVIRSFVENKMYGNVSELPKKLYYMGPMFRYDRPQKGRYRQFSQFGIEAIGASNPLLDVETITLGLQICHKLNITNLKVLINSLGDEQSRMNYRNALLEHFKPYLSELCGDCQRRYQQNPLRILDCKVDKDAECFKTAPKIIDYLNDESKKYFENVIQGLKDLNISYQIDDRLVRGLDYYSNTVYEVVPISDEGQQATIFGGGQYNGLVDYFGGGNLAGVGFGMGIDRLIELAITNNTMSPLTKEIDCYLIAIGDVSDYPTKICQMLRNSEISCDMDYLGRSLKAQFKSSDKLNSKFTLIVGEDEFSQQVITVKDNTTKQQETVSFNELVDYLNKGIRR